MIRTGWIVLLVIVLRCTSAAQPPAISDALIQYSTQNTPIKSVFRDVNLRFGLRFSYNLEDVENIRITGTWNDVLADDFVRELLLPHHLNYRVVGKTYVVFAVEQLVQESTQDTTLSISGVVRDDTTGETLPFAVIRIPSTRRVITANAEGRFLLGEIPSDTSTIIFSFIGYVPKVVRYREVVFKQRARIDLSPSFMMLGALEINEERIDPIEVKDQTSVVAVRPNDIGTSAAQGEPDIMRAAQLFPGISATNESSGGLIIRGSDADQTIVRLDDFTVYHLDHFFGAFSALNSLAIKNILVFKGSQDARFGGRVGGLVEVIGKDGNLYQPNLQVDLSSLSFSFLVESPIGQSERASLMIAGRRSYTDFLFTPTYKNVFKTIYGESSAISNSNQGYVFNEGSQPKFFFMDFTSKITFRPTPKHLIQFSTYAGRDNLEIDYRSSIQNGRITADYFDQSEWGNTGFGTKWIYTMNDHWNTRFTAGYSRFNSDLFAQDTLVDNLLQLVNSNFRYGRLNLIDFTGRAEVNYVTSKAEWSAGVHWNAVAIERTEEVQGVNTFGVTNASIVSPYVQVQFNLNKWLITPGMRYSVFSEVAGDYFEPRLNGLYRANDHFTWKFFGGRVIQFLHRYKQQSLYLNDPDGWIVSDGIDLPVLRSDQFTIGFQYKKNKVLVDVEGYFKHNRGVFEYLGTYSEKLNSEIEFVTGYGYVSGADLLIQYEYENHFTWLSYSYLNTSNYFEELGNIPEIFDQRHEVKLSYDFRWKKWQFMCSWIAGSGRPYTPVIGVYEVPVPDNKMVYFPVYGDLNSLRLPAYHRADVAVSRGFELKNVTGKITFSIFNVYNKNNVRDIRYSAVTSDQSIPVIVENRIFMQSFLPSLLLHLDF